MKYLILGVFLAVAAVGQSQNCNYTLTGRVIDFHDGSALTGATVEIVGQQKYALTDFEGQFNLKRLCAGTIEVQITHPECDRRTFKVRLDGNLERDFKMEHHIEALEDVQVVGERFKNLTETATEETLSGTELDDYSSGSLGQALMQVTGVSSLSTGTTIVKPIIQGLHSSRISIINNGVRMADQEWGVEHAPSLDVNSAARVTVIKGPGALRYSGDAVGGIIITESKNAPIKDTLFGKTILKGSSNGRGGSATSSLTKAFDNGWYAQGQGTYTYTGDLESPDYVLSNTGVRGQDFSLAFGLNKFTYGFDAYFSSYSSELGILRASHIGSVPDLIRAINSGEPNFIRSFDYEINAPRQEVDHQLARISVFKRFERAGKWNLDYSFQRNNRLEFDIRRGDDRNKASLNLELTTHILATNFNYDAGRRFSGDIGLEGTYQVNFPDPATGVRRLIPDYERYTAAAYATANYVMTENFQLESGVRYDHITMDAEKFYQNSRWAERGYEADYGQDVVQRLDNQLLVNPVFQFDNISASIGARYVLDENVSGLINISSVVRAPNPAELFSDGLHHSAAAIELGDLRLRPERGLKFSKEFNAILNNFQFTMNPYFNYIRDFIILEPGGLELTTRGAFPVNEYRQVDARLYGIDINLAYTINTNFNIESKFAYVNGKDLDRDRPLIDMPPANWNTGLRYSVESWNKLNLTLSNQTVFEQTRFPDNDFEVEYVNTEGEAVSETVLISQPPPAYSLLHFKASAEFKWIKKTNTTVSLFVDNLLNTAYRDYLNRQRYYADDLGRNFSLQLKINY
ncbi:MAG: TonB-dependent receptor [Leeuwenhoekiella sp.]